MPLFYNDTTRVVLMTVPASELAGVKRIWKTAKFDEPMVEVTVEQWEIDESEAKNTHIKTGKKTPKKPLIKRPIKKK